MVVDNTMRGARPLAKAQEAPCVRPSRWLLRQGHVRMYVQMCIKCVCLHLLMYVYVYSTKPINQSTDQSISQSINGFHRPAKHCLLRRLALWSPKPRVRAQNKCLACMPNAHSCLKAQPASPPRAEARPLGASQRLGHAVPLGALRRATACPPRQEVQ